MAEKSELEYILCVGDSLTFGARDEYHSSYPAELSRLFFERQNRNVYGVNQNVSGETSGELLRRVYANAKSCLQARLVLLLIGTNDTFLPQRPNIFADNLRQIIAVLRDQRVYVGVGILPPVIGPGLPNYPSDAQDQVDRFNEIITDQAEIAGCFVADFREMGEYIIDTVHFDHAGYVRMAEIWYRAISDHTDF